MAFEGGGTDAGLEVSCLSSPNGCPPWRGGPCHVRRTCPLRATARAISRCRVLCFAFHGGELPTHAGRGHECGVSRRLQQPNPHQGNMWPSGHGMRCVEPPRCCGQGQRSHDGQGSSTADELPRSGTRGTVRLEGCCQGVLGGLQIGHTNPEQACLGSRAMP